MINEKDNQKKIQTHQHFKRNQNKITELLKTCKQRYYQKYFEENKQSCKPLLNDIHEIIYSTKRKNPVLHLHF